MFNSSSLSAITLLVSLLIGPVVNAAQPFSLEQEINTLNQEFGRSMGYPIVVLNKEHITYYIEQNQPKNEAEQVELLRAYVLHKHRVEMSKSEGSNLLPYITLLKESAVAMPFFEKDQIKSCYVMPSFNKNTHLQEVQRILGHDPAQNIYNGFNFSKAQSWLSHDELKLYSLYHELSHCFDKVYLKEANVSGEPHSIHQGEVFAEVNAMFLLAKKKSLFNLGFGRAMLRGTYSKYMGPFLANQPPSMAGEAYNKGGSIYFLSLPLLKAQQIVDSNSFRSRNISVNEMIDMSHTIVRFNSLPSRSFHALYTYFKDGRQSSLDRYLQMARRNPDLFLQAYSDLLNYDAFLVALEQLN